MTDVMPDADTVPDFPMTRAPGCPFAPPPKALAANASRQLSRVRIWDGSTPWLITGYEAIRSLFADARASVDDRKPGYPHWNEGMLATVDRRPRSVFTSDAEEHTRYRRMLSRPFTFKRVEALRPAVQKITDDHIDAILAGPQTGRHRREAHAAGPVAGDQRDARGAVRGRRVLPGAGQPGHEPLRQRRGLRERRRRAVQVPDEPDHHEDGPTPPRTWCPISPSGVKAEEISVKEAAQLATGVLIAGHETTAGQLSVSVVALLENPEQQALLRDTDDPKVIAAAVEELMRYCSIIQTGQRRIAVEDIEVDGETIRAGEGIILDVAPANWDARQFPDPDRLDLLRQNGPHVGFGYGRHQCVGQQLARMELQIVLPSLLRRIPTIRLAVPLDELPFKHDALAYGLYELPVTW